MAKNIRSSIRAALLANANLVALVGQQVSSRYAPRDFTGVWIVFNRISGQTESSMDGDEGLIRPRYQFTISSTDGDKVDQVVDILTKEFNGFQYTAFPGTGDEQEITFFHDDDNDSWEESVRHIVATVDLFVQAYT